MGRGELWWAAVLLQVGAGEKRSDRALHRSLQKVMPLHGVGCVLCPAFSKMRHVPLRERHAWFWLSILARKAHCCWVT